MENGINMEKTIHQGRNVKRIREMLGIKQEALAIELGNEWTQRRISLLEQKEEIEPEILEEVAKSLKIPVEAIKNFDEQAAVSIISNNYHDNAASIQYNFNPIDKIVELYERLLQSEKDKSDMLQKMLEKNAN